MRILLINGPNLNLLGSREPALYGKRNLHSIQLDLKKEASKDGIDLDCFQSNSEGDLIDRIHDSIGEIDGILINAGAYTHTSIALRDALLSSAIPYVELHLTNTFGRESFRHKSFLSENAVGVVIGFGSRSYDLALKGLLAHLNNYE